jgi:aspartyl/asparaginyl beta-hydroxylase (cupin superfamily)
MSSCFYKADQWAYTPRLIDSLELLQKEFYRYPALFRQQTKEQKIAVTGSWQRISFMEKGQSYYLNCLLFPTIRRLLRELPIHDNCIISIIGPNATISKHPGHSNRHLRVHFCLDTVGGAFMRIGNEQQEWRTGKVMIFQDSEIHEVVNTVPYERTVLLFDIKREDYFDNLIK